MRPGSLLALSFLCSLAASAQKVDYVREVRPILSDRCFACHGPDEANRKANLRLDTKEGMEAALAKIGPRIAHEKKALRMPPPQSGVLTEPQIATLQKWIGQGGEWKMHWSYLPPKRAEAPVVKNAAWARTDIDRFILARLEKENLKPAPRAGKATLLRRVSLDLTGLPPTPAEVTAFLNDTSANAYEKVVDRLLASPHYGERMAMPWLDLARYADTHGYHIDSHRDMSAWRDWVINSFNQNLPYDKFTVWQLAGDLLPNPSKDQLLATAFNRNHMINYEGGAIPEEYLTEYVIDRVEATANVWMGMTMGCARCHDHKYDPIRQKEFYRFFAFFNTVREKGLDGSRGNAEPVLKLPNTWQQSRLDAISKRTTELEAWLDERDVVALREGWEFQQPKFPAPPTANEKGTAAASLRFKMSSRLDTVESLLLDQPQLKVWIDGGEAIGRNRRGSRLYFQSGAQVWRTKDNFVTGDWQHAALNLTGTPVLYLDTKPVTLEPAKATAPKNPPKGSKEDIRFFDRALTADEIRILAIDEPAKAILAIAADKRSGEQRRALLDYFFEHGAPAGVRDVNRELRALYLERDDLDATIPSAMVMSEMAIPRESKVLARGDYRNGTEVVTPGVPSFLPPLSPSAPKNRLGLAQWLTSGDHPLTARVAVNRFWQMYFGTGLVKTVEDFGSQGEYPMHVELLDWLATEFVQSGWDVRHMQKLIVMSAAYQQSSKVTPELHEKDPENRLVARGPRFRLPAELVRDNALAVSGLLSGKIGGESVLPYHPPGVWEDIAYGDTFSAQRYVQDHGDKLYRRSMYSFWKRTAPPVSLATFDAPDREKCIARRATTNTPLQALVLLNDPTYIEAARVLAAQAMATPDPLAFMFHRAVSRAPSAQESTLLRAQLAKQVTLYRNWQEGVDKLLKVGEAPVPAGRDRVMLAAWTTVASTILNLDETITKE
ncbi:MAG: DUF1553 domain-containing protein [Acidobacteria bacterium]|nr:DUF1553 domain-containing protein [Acidobacteriota bacterium]